uniref:Uncharacterized protein n=1 Tax=Schistocephalus solidus TaxID=70667 RepID=A0A0X3PH54_SCHSO
MHSLDTDTKEKALTDELRRHDSHRSWFRRSKKKPEKENSHTLDDRPINKAHSLRSPIAKPPAEAPKAGKQPEDASALQLKLEHIIRENDYLLNENTTFRYQIEILTEKVTELTEANRKLLFGASQMREEISCLQHDCSILTSKNDALISQLTEMRQILIDAGVSPTVPCETESNGVDAGPVSHPFGLPDSPERDIDTPPTANQKIL